MRKDEYLSEVTAGIKNKQVKQEICAELGEHIDELADFYLDRGYSDTEAEEKAVSEMGDGELVGYDLSKLHKDKITVVGTVLFILFLAVYTLLHLILASFEAYESSGCVSDGAVLFDCLFIIVMIIMMAVSVKKKSLIRCAAVFVSFFSGIFIWHILDGYKTSICSNITINLMCLLTNNFETMYRLTHSHIDKVSWVFLVISFVFYFLYLYVFFVNLLSVKKLSKQNYSQKDRNLSKVSSLALTTLLIFTVTFSVAYLLIQSTYESDSTSPTYTVESTLIAQNYLKREIDKATKISTANDFDYVKAFNRIDPEWGIENVLHEDETDYYTFEQCSQEHKLFHLMTYTENIFKLEIYPDKPYVFIHSTDWADDAVVSEMNTGWYETNQEIHYYCKSNEYYNKSLLEVVIHPINYEKDYDHIIYYIVSQLSNYPSWEFADDISQRIAKMTNSTFFGDAGSSRYIGEFVYDEHLSFTLFGMGFNKCVFSIDGEEYKTVELDQSNQD